jgi:very-short-patch-repair endonuclease
MASGGQDIRIDDIPRAEVRVFGVPDVSPALARIEARARAHAASRRVVTRSWDDPPELATLIDDALAALATGAACIWPAWYGRDTVDARPASRSLASAADGHTIAALHAELGAIASAWAEAAFACCRAARIPLVRAVPRAVQAAQLALAIEPDGIVIVFACRRPDPPDARVLGMAKAAEWIAREAAAKVALIVHERLLDNAALEPVLYGAARLGPEIAPATDDEGRRDIRVFPVIGRPHPMSPGEQRLFARLTRDPELGGLFACNQRVRTARGSEPLCDLHWAEGRLVVEIDGEGWHGERWAFRADRHRDYELMATGYRVLRLTHDEVMEDVEIAVEKIRDIVRLCLPGSTRVP